MKQFTELDTFTQAYITAMFWTENESLPDPNNVRVGGMDYRDTGRLMELFGILAESTLAAMEADCAKFQTVNADMLAQVGTADQNGHDFWLTRNHHGSGFWDRGYPESVSKNLTDAAHATGEAYIYTGDDGKIYS